PDWNPIRRGVPRFADLTAEEQEALIRENPDYGELICRCQKVTKAEILAAIRNPLGVHTVTGVKYRTRAMMGRCQGGYCQMRITRMLEEECGLKPEEITYARKGSQMLFGEVIKEAAHGKN
nr:(2Fe-2S)-binding protein [Clostridiales bacterium]